MGSRRHAAAVIVVMFGVAGCRTTTPPQNPVSPPEQPATASTRAPDEGVATAAIFGFVAEAGTDVPLESALVVLSATERVDQRLALTDDKGYYQLTQLPAGFYTVRASSTGYVGRSASANCSGRERQ